jgi:hypothetical protein
MGVASKENNFSEGRNFIHFSQYVVKEMKDFCCFPQKVNPISHLIKPK